MLNRLRNDALHVYFFFSQEICQRRGPNERPQMFVGQSDRFDINQGEIGNCWFLAAVANLVENKKCFKALIFLWSSGLRVERGIEKQNAH